MISPEEWMRAEASSWGSWEKINVMRQASASLLGTPPKVQGVLTTPWALFLGFFHIDSCKSHTNPTRWILLTSPFRSWQGWFLFVLVDKDGFLWWSSWNIYKYWVILLYTWNEYNVACQLNLKKEKKKRVGEAKETETQRVSQLGSGWARIQAYAKLASDPIFTTAHLPKWVLLVSEATAPPLQAARTTHV